MLVKVWWRSSALILLLFLLICAGVYWNSTSNPFQFDDERVVVLNKNIQSLSNIPGLFTNPKMFTSVLRPGEGHYRPLTEVSYAINYAIGKLNPFGYHLLNMIFHAGTAFLIFLIVKAMLGSTSEARSKKQEVRSKKEEARSETEEAREQIPPGHPLLKGGNIMADPSFLKVGWGGGVFFAALASGLIFLVHPFNSEAINYLTARSSVMSGFFYLLAFWCWVKFRSKKQEVRREEAEARSKMEEARSQTEEVRSQQQEARGKKQDVRKNLASYLLPLTSNFLPLTSCFYLFSLFAFIAGMLSKEIVITLPIILWIYDLYFKEKSQSSFRISNYLSYLPFIILGIIPYFLIRMASFGGVIPSFQRDLWTQILTELPVLMKHWKMFIFPAGLTPFHQVNVVQSLWVLPVIFSALFLAGYIIVAIFLFRVSSYIGRVASFFMFWFFIVLLPTTIIPLNTIFQENRGYLAIVSFTAIAGILIGELLYRRSRAIGVAVIVVLIISSSITSVYRNRVWKDELTLWGDAVKKSPDSYQVYTALGVAYRRASMYNHAVDATRKALLLGGDQNFVAHDNLGRIFMAQEKWGLAAMEFEKALKVYPSYAVNHNDLGVVYFKMEKYDLAEQRYNEAIRLDSNYFQPHFNAGVLYTVKGNYSEAIKEYQKAIDIYPGHLKSWLHIGILLDDMGKKKEASGYFKFVLKNAQKEDAILAKEAARRLLKTGGIREGG